MKIDELSIPGVFSIAWDRHTDERGFFQRVLCVQTLEELGLVSEFTQHSISFNTHSGTLRGMHLQLPPHAETKLVTCIAGKVLDVIVDVRPDSPGFGEYCSVTLDSRSPGAVYIPAGCAHGFVTVSDNSMLLYAIDVPFAPDASTGFHYADPAVSINWSHPVLTVSDADAALAGFDGLSDLYTNSLDRQ